MRKVKKIIVSNSNLQSYRKCGQLFNMENILLLEPVEGNLAIDFGSTIHKGLEQHLNGQPIDMLSFIQEENIRLPAEGRYSLQHAANLVERYRNYYPDTDRKILRTEQEYTIQVTDRIFYNGSIDVELEKDGKFLLQDHKTTSGFSSFIPMAKPNHQATGYYFLAHAVHGVMPEGFEFDGIHTKILTFTDPTKLFLRHTTTRTQEEIDEWKEGMIKDTNKLIADLEANDFGFSDTACNMYGRCKFADVCSLAPSNRATFIKNAFNVKDKAHKFEVEFEE